MVMMLGTAELYGAYTGHSRVREGMEASLTPAERKRLAKGEAAAPLVLREDRTFTHKKTTWGYFEVRGDRVCFFPKEFNGATLETMRTSAEQAGRNFGLSWLFDPFELHISGEGLVSDAEALIYVEYRRN